MTNVKLIALKLNDTSRLDPIIDGDTLICGDSNYNLKTLEEVKATGEYNSPHYTYNNGVYTYINTLFPYSTRNNFVYNETEDGVSYDNPIQKHKSTTINGDPVGNKFYWYSKKDGKHYNNNNHVFYYKPGKRPFLVEKNRYGKWLINGQVLHGDSTVHGFGNGVLYYTMNDEDYGTTELRYIFNNKGRLKNGSLGPTNGSTYKIAGGNLIIDGYSNGYPRIYKGLELLRNLPTNVSINLKVHLKYITFVNINSSIFNVYDTDGVFMASIQLPDQQWSCFIHKDTIIIDGGEYYYIYSFNTLK